MGLKFVLITSLFSQDVVINKILYNKTLISYQQEVLINVFLNPMKAIDVIVMVNDQQIYDITKNFSNTEDEAFLPSFSFIVDNLKQENDLKVFVTLSQGITVVGQAKLHFKKALVLDNNNASLSNNKIFFLKAGPMDGEMIPYKIEIENNFVVELIDTQKYENILYYKLKSIASGESNISIFLPHSTYENGFVSPYKQLHVTIQ